MKLAVGDQEICFLSCVHMSVISSPRAPHPLSLLSTSPLMARIILMCTSPVIQFTVQALSSYLRNTEVTNLFNVQVMEKKTKKKTSASQAVYPPLFDVYDFVGGFCNLFRKAPNFGCLFDGLERASNVFRQKKCRVLGAAVVRCVGDRQAEATMPIPCLVCVVYVHVTCLVIVFRCTAATAFL